MDGYLDGATAYLQANPLVAAALGLVLLYLLVRKTRFLLFLLVLAMVLGAAFFLIAELAGKGAASKTELINQTATQETK